MVVTMRQGEEGEGGEGEEKNSLDGWQSEWRQKKRQVVGVGVRVRVKVSYHIANAVHM